METPYYLLISHDEVFDMDKYTRNLNKLSLYGCSHVLMVDKILGYEGIEKILSANYSNKMNTSLIIDFRYQIFDEIIVNFFGQITCFIVMIKSAEDIIKSEAFFTKYNKYGIRFICAAFDEKIWNNCINHFDDKVSEYALVNRNQDSILLHYKEVECLNKERYLGMFISENESIEWSLDSMLTCLD